MVTVTETNAMKVSQIDRSNYYRSMLVLIGRDRIIADEERKMMTQLGKLLDFDLRFCEAAIADLLNNEHITDDPILFEDPRTAECFLKDGLRMALADKEIHSREMDWLKTIARTNKIAEEWLELEYRRTHETKENAGLPEPYSIQKLL
jgi:hypothetical protein